MAQLGWEARFSEPVDLVISQGSDMDLPMRWTEDAVGVPLATDGWDARAQLRKRPGSDVWLELTTTEDAMGNVITLEDDGIITIHIDNTETEQAAWSAPSRAQGVWDLEVIDPTGSPMRLCMGSVRVSREVTADD